MNNIPYVGFFKRAAAFIIDSIIAAIPAAVICFPLMWITASEAPVDSSSEEALGVATLLAAIYVLWQILGIVSYWLYFALLESGKHQATWGKRWLGIKVVGANGERISFGRATGRLFAKFLSYMTMYIGFLMAGNTNRKRALHDYVAQTYVVHKDFQPGEELPDTPSHMVRLGVIIAAIMLVFGIGILSLVASSTPMRANVAARRLQQLAQEKTPLREPLAEKDIVYSLSRSGYRAHFTNAQDEPFTLWLQPQTGTVCCERFPGENCLEAGIPECN